MDTERIIVLMADLDEQSQAMLTRWYKKLKEAGFTGSQTKGIPFHITLGSFSLDNEQNVIEEMERMAKTFSTIEVTVSRIDTFEGNEVLYCAPDLNDQLSALKAAITVNTIDEYSWTPHVTMLIDEPTAIDKAYPILKQSFIPFEATITRLHLCAFWPTREIKISYLRK